MAHSNSYVANDLEFAEKIEERFNEYVALFVKLHFPEGDHVLPEAERRELNVKIKATVNEITLLGLKRKGSTPVVNVVAKYSSRTESSLQTAPN